jgi:hypothetical protein
MNMIDFSATDSRLSQRLMWNLQMNLGVTISQLIEFWGYKNFFHRIKITDIYLIRAAGDHNICFVLENLKIISFLSIMEMGK